MVFVESMISGTPIIASKAYEMRYFVEHGKNGYLLNSQSVEELADLMEKIMNNDYIFSQVSIEKEFVKKKYSWDKVAETIYNEIKKY